MTKAKEDKRQKKDKDKFGRRITVTFTDAQYSQVESALKRKQEEQLKLGVPIDAATFCRMLLLKATEPDSASC